MKGDNFYQNIKLYQHLLFFKKGEITLHTKVIAKTLLIISLLTSVVYAATLGTLSYWYATDTNSHTNVIARWKFTPNLWSGVMDSNSFTTSKFADYVNHAKVEWQLAGIQTYGVDNSSDAHIRIYGGTYSTLSSMEPSLTTSDAGLTTGGSTKEGEWYYNGVIKYGYTMDAPIKVYIVYKSGKSDNGYKKTTTHEFGHSLGWIGESTNSSDIMYGASTENIYLTSRDKNHLVQVYK